jgi:pyrroline-5-carboxylate reductase
MSTLLHSIAAGVSLDAMEGRLNSGARVYRCTHTHIHMFIHYLCTTVSCLTLMQH